MISFATRSHRSIYVKEFTGASLGPKRGSWLRSSIMRLMPLSLGTHLPLQQGQFSVTNLFKSNLFKSIKSIIYYHYIILSILNLLSRFRIDKMISFTTRVQTILCWNSSQSLQNRTFDCRCSWCSKLLFLLFGWSLSFPLSWWNL